MSYLLFFQCLVSTVLTSLVGTVVCKGTTIYKLKYQTIMKRNLLFVLVALMAMTLSAQENRGRSRQREYNPEQVALMQTQQLSNVVGLDSLQFQLVYIMNYSDAVAMQDSMKVRRARMEEARKSGKKIERQRPTEEQMQARREVMKQRKAVKDAQMKEILNPEQYEKYLKYSEEQEKRRRSWGENRDQRRERGERRGERK